MVEDIELIFNSALEALNDSQIALDNQRYKI